MDELKRSFLTREFWILSFGGAFQRANVYKSKINELARKNFRGSLIELMEKYVKEKYETRKIDGQEHCKNIEELCKAISNKWGDILKNKRFRIGVCQKLLNLYLKYLWCVGLIEEPPHCPIDRTIIAKCPAIGNINWPEIDDINIYKKIIFEINANARNSNLTVAQWELKNFQRRS